MAHIYIPEPSLALNANKVPGHPYKMTYEDEVLPHESAEDIVKTIERYAAKSSGGFLESLVINAHGGPAEIKLGKGFGLHNTNVFDKLLVKKKPIVSSIYLVVCWVALIWRTGDGNIFCCRMAKNAGAYVIAPRAWQKPPSKAVPKNYIDKFEDTNQTPDGKRANRHWGVLKYNPDGSNQLWNGVPVRVARNIF